MIFPLALVDFKVPYYYCVAVNFPLCLLAFALCIEKLLFLVHCYLQLLYLLGLVPWSLCIVFISCSILYFKVLVCLIWKLLLWLSFDFHLHRIPYSNSRAFSLCVSLDRKWVFSGIYVTLYLCPFGHCFFHWSYLVSPLKIVTDAYVLTAVLLIVLGLLL